MEGLGSATGADGSTGSFAPLDAVWVHNDCLRANMEAAGEKFAPGEQAAHIVPRNMASRSAEVQKSINDARAVLNQYDLLDANANGFKAMPGHLGTHTDDFLSQLGKRITAADATGGRDGVIAELAKLKGEIVDGNFNER